MSSLRLALKQSLQETGHLAPKEKKKKKSSSAPRQRGRPRQPGDPPRKRGRPPKNPRPHTDSSEPASENADDDGAKQVGGEEASYSSENEFSYDSDMSQEEDDEEEGEIDEEGDHQETEDDPEAKNDGPLDREGDHGEKDGDKDITSLDDTRIRREQATFSDEERRNEQKLLKKQLKHSAANKIQSQWKKSKRKAPDDDKSLELVKEKKASTNDGHTDATTTEKFARKNSPVTENPAGNSKIKKKRKSGTVPAPLLDVLEWSRSLGQKKCRKHVAKGMRVKVRFTTEVTREGKVAKKKIWYGGRVSAAAEDRSKIKIKYDDGTSEISEFPDKDVVVDDTGNGQHLDIVQGAAKKFVPPIFREEEIEAKEEVVMPDKEESTADDPPAADQQDEKELDLAQVVEETTTPVTEDYMDKNADGAENTQSLVEEKDQESNTAASDAGTTDAPSSETSKRAVAGYETKPEETGNPTLKPAEETMTEDSPKESEAPVVKTKEEANEKSEDYNEGESTPPSSKPSLTIRIPNVKKGETAETPKLARTPETHDYSTEEELHADTPVTERKVKSLKVKRKRPSNDALPESGSPHAKKRKPDSEASQDFDMDLPEADSKGLEQSPKKGAKTISISLKRAESVAVPTIPALAEGTTDKETATSPIPTAPISPVPSAESPQPMLTDLVKSFEENSIIKPVSHQASEVGMKVDSSETVETVEKIVVGGSIGSAFGQKLKLSEAVDENEGLSKSNGSTDSLPRAGRKAAEEAKEKLSMKQDPSERDTGKRKKKRKRKEGKGSDGEDSDEDDRQWVQCDKCKKWRILPTRVQAASLPEKWYCSLNTYDLKHNECSSPEQTVKQVAKEWRRARKRIKQQRLEQAALDASRDDAKKDDSTRGKGVKSPANSPKHATAHLSSRKGDNDSKRSSPIDAVISAPVMEVDPDPPKPKKRGRKPKKEKEKEKEKEEAKLNEVDKTVDTPPDVTPKKPGRKRGRPARNANSDGTRVSSSEKKDDDNVEWVQCEKCEKWRKLPPYMSADELPDTWYCTMNTWNPGAASCETAEDKADAHHQEVGVFGNIPQGHAGKYSYRSMIFGNGRKQNRPMSEKSRAAESLFQKPTADEGNPQTSVMYAKSSMFLPRTSNFHKAQVVEEKSTGIFDALRDSELWTELQGVGQAMEFISDGSIGRPQHNFFSYENLPEVMKETMREVVLQALGLYVLTGDDVVHEAQRFPWESLPNGLSLIRAYVNADIIINTLLSLVKDGFVEMTCFKDMSKPMSEWIPRYRRVVQRKQKRNIETEEAVKASKCMKIAKPWKNVDNGTEWITGGE